MTDSSMNKKELSAATYLNRIRDIEKSIHDKELELEALRYKASGAGAITYDKDRVMTSPNSFLEMAIGDIIELSKQIEEDKASIDETKGNAYSIVRKLSKADERAIIEWYYLNGLQMNEVAERMHMSERNAYYLRNNALTSFGEYVC